MKHTMRNVNETGLTILHNMLVNVSGHAAAQDFYKVFFVSLLEHIFAVVSDPAHQSGFKQICDILALMIALVEAGDIKVPLWEAAQVTDPAMTNQLFVRQYLATLLQSAFPNLQPYVHARGHPTLPSLGQAAHAMVFVLHAGTRSRSQSRSSSSSTRICPPSASPSKTSSSKLRYAHSSQASVYWARHR